MLLKRLRSLIYAEIGRCVFDFDALAIMEQEARRAAVSPNIVPAHRNEYQWFADAAAALRRRTKRKILC